MTVHDMPVKPDPLARYDALGRKHPKKLGAIESIRALPWLMTHFSKRVPEDYWSLQVDPESDKVLEPHVALVRCPCGLFTPELTANVFVDCEGGDVCGRTYLFTGVSILVARAEPDSAVDQA